MGCKNADVIAFAVAAATQSSKRPIMLMFRTKNKSRYTHDIYCQPTAPQYNNNEEVVKRNGEEFRVLGFP
jgi:hypothetical protein